MLVSFKILSKKFIEKVQQFLPSLKTDFFFGDQIDEPETHRQVKSKRFEKKKVLFLAAVATPRFDANENGWFEGKFGIELSKKWSLS